MTPAGGAPGAGFTGAGFTPDAGFAPGAVCACAVAVKRMAAVPMARMLGVFMEWKFGAESKAARVLTASEDKTQSAELKAADGNG